MKREQRKVGRYYKLAPKDRLDMIYSNYDCFPGIIADFEFEITDWIKANKAKARRDAIGELGVELVTPITKTLLQKMKPF